MSGHITVTEDLKPQRKPKTKHTSITEVADQIKAINKETGESANILKRVYNEVNTTFEILEPKLVEVVQKIRSSRMAVTSELRQSLSIMQDVRRFFLESDHKKEMERLENFVALAERMKHLIDDGTMDAITDVVLKLSVNKEGE